MAVRRRLEVYKPQFVMGRSELVGRLAGVGGCGILWTIKRRRRRGFSDTVDIAGTGLDHLADFNVGLLDRRRAVEPASGLSPGLAADVIAAVVRSGADCH